MVTRRVLLLALALLTAACTSSGGSNAGTGTPPRGGVDGSATRSGANSAGPARPVPHFAHIVVVVEENHSYPDVIASADAPYINRLAASGALLARSFAITHPSEPNYLALFSGSTHGVDSDACPLTFAAGNLATQLSSRGESFAAYSESLPSPGFSGCSAGSYARKHAPWTDFRNVPAAVGRPMTAFPADFDRLPRVAFVVPNLDDDMHDGTVAEGDSWLQSHLGRYVTWARTHDSLLIVTWDEDDDSANNHIPGLLAGAHVRPVRYGGRVDHYRMLRTLEAACGLPALGRARNRQPITSIWS